MTIGRVYELTFVPRRRGFPHAVRVLSKHTRLGLARVADVHGGDPIVMELSILRKHYKLRRGQGKPMEDKDPQGVLF